MTAKKRELTVENFTAEVVDNDHVLVTLGDEKLRTDRAGVARLIKALSAAATVAR